MKLHELAHARSGDKGSTADISVIAYHPAHYPHLRTHLTPPFDPVQLKECVRPVFEFGACVRVRVVARLAQ